ncbi:MAG: hypothetical protein ACM3PW_16725 [Chlamydiota bacterium]
MTRHVVALSTAVVILLVLVMAGCGDSSSDGSISVSVSPAAVELGASETQQFAATVTNTSNTAVTWSLNCSGGDCGAINSAGLYTAPAQISAELTVTVTATSQADSRANSTATVNQAPLSVQVSPRSVMTMTQGGVQRFTASVTRHSNKNVTWSMSGKGCSGSACGTLSNVTTSAATYTAPSVFAAPATVLVTVTPAGDPNRPQAIKLNLMRMAASLNGRYAFVFRTSDSSLSFAASLVADGVGHLSGTGDLITATATYPRQPFTGTYTLGGDHRGTMHIIGGGVTLDLRFVMMSGNFGRLMDFSSASDGSGWFEKQNESAFSTAALAGSHDYLLAGVTGSTFMSRVGDQTVTSACKIHGHEEVNDATMAMFPGGYGWDNFEADCTLDTVTGRGTLATTSTYLLYVPKMASYVVDVGHAVMAADLGKLSMRLSGEMQAVASSALGGTYTCYVVTSNGLSAGRLTFTSGTVANTWAITGIMDEVDDTAAMPDLPVTGAIAADGTTTVIIGSTALEEPRVYVVSPERLILTGNGFYGEAYLQEGGPFSSSMFQGDYGLQLLGQDVHAIGMAHLMPPAITGKVDVSNNGVLTSDADISGFMTFLSGDRADVTLTTFATGTLEFRAYVISPEKLLLVSKVPGQVTMGWAEEVD